MKKNVKKAISKATPGRVHFELDRLKRIDEVAHNNQAAINELKDIVQKGHDTRLDLLKRQVLEIEQYQPTYGITGILTQQPKRDSVDRCRAINGYLGEVHGLRMIDVGSSLGYVCFYFGDRGAKMTGWETNPKNAEVARLIGDINGIDAKFKTKYFDKDTIPTIKKDEVDVVIILSVLHHVIYHNGVKYVQEMMRDLFERVPTVIVELAKKGEDKSLFWDKSQPKNELDIFDLVEGGVDVKEIGTFHNHLSNNKRPLYAVTAKNKFITVNGHGYAYDKKSTQAYTDSPAQYLDLPRRYYFGDKHIVKEYLFEDKHNRENSRQIVAEINRLLHLKDVHNMPEMTDFELSSERARLAITRIKGDLITDIKEGLKSEDVEVIAKDVLKSLTDLEKQGLVHNDVRSWNVIFDGKKASLIDFGVVSHRSSDKDSVSLMWMLNAALTGEREGYGTDKKELPPSKAFSGSKPLTKLYEKVKAGEDSPARLLKVVSGAASK